MRAGIADSAMRIAVYFRRTMKLGKAWRFVFHRGDFACRGVDPIENG